MIYETEVGVGVWVILYMPWVLNKLDLGSVTLNTS